MQYREVNPGPALRGHVKCVWFLRGAGKADDRGVERIVPDGCAEIVLHRAAPMIASGPETAARVQSSAMIVGQISRCLFLQATGEIDVVGIRFTPNGLFSLLGIPAAELTDRSVEISAWSAGYSRELVDAVAAPGDCLPRLERLLLKALPARGNRLDVVSAAIERIVATNGALLVGELCQRLNVGGRQLERRFEREVGLGPKLFARIVRFAAVVRQAQTGRTRNGAWLAQRFGYADQAHLVREFRQFAGTSPGAYFGEDHPISSLLTSGGDVGFVQSH